MNPKENPQHDGNQDVTPYQPPKHATPYCNRAQMCQVCWDLRRPGTAFNYILLTINPLQNTNVPDLHKIQQTWHTYTYTYTYTNTYINTNTNSTIQTNTCTYTYTTIPTPSSHTQTHNNTKPTHTHTHTHTPTLTPQHAYPPRPKPHITIPNPKCRSNENVYERAAYDKHQKVKQAHCVACSPF